MDRFARWIPVRKVRAALFAVLGGAAVGGLDAAGAIDWGGLGSWGPVLGAGVAALLAYIARSTGRGGELPPGGEPTDAPAGP